MTDRASTDTERAAEAGAAADKPADEQPAEDQLADEQAADGPTADGPAEEAAGAEDTEGRADEDTQAGAAAAGEGPDEPVVPPEVWKIVAVADVEMDLPNAYPEIVLHEAQHPWRELRIPVGLAEGTAIAYAFRGLETPRPLTHTMMTEVLDRHGVTIAAARITVRRGKAFFAEIDTMGPRGRQVVPCRPSDALALALRQRMPTPILVADWVFAAEEDDDGAVGSAR